MTFPKFVAFVCQINFETSLLYCTLTRFMLHAFRLRISPLENFETSVLTVFLGRIVNYPVVPFCNYRNFK